MFRRRLPPELEAPFAAFRAIVGDLERAKDVVLTSVPTTRLAGRPLAETLAEFEESLNAVASGMDRWRAEAVEDAWEAARAGLDRSRVLAERLRLSAEMPVGFEALVGTIADLLDPLDAFEGAAERFRALRRR